MNPTQHFWDVSLANVVTWIILVLGFGVSQYVIVKLQGERLNGHDAALREFKDWIKQHQVDSNERDQILARLTTLAQSSERRLEKLEDGDRRTYMRRDDPPPYFGEERRGKK